MVQSPGMLHGKDLIDDHKGHDLVQESGVRIPLETDHHVMTKIEDIVHQVDDARIQGNDAETDHVKENLGTNHVRENVVDLETDHMKEDEADQGTGNLDITADHLDVNSIFLIIETKIL